jgi:hypothetical protein
VFEAIFCSLAHFMNKLPCHGRDLPAASSGTHGVLPGVFSLFRALPSRIRGSVREGVRLPQASHQGCCGEVSGLRQSDVRVCPHPVSGLRGGAALDVFLQDTRSELRPRARQRESAST